MTDEFGVRGTSGCVTAYHSQEDAQRVVALAPDRYVLVRRSVTEWEETS